MEHLTDPADGLLRTMTRQECWDRLSTHTTGRLGYVDRGCPVILPMNYAAYDDAIWLRTASYNQVGVHLHEQQAAFEIDQSDEATRSGWSVLVRGRATHVRSAADAPPSWETARPWPEGIRTMTFRIEATTVTGRILRPGAAGHGREAAPDPSRHRT